MFVQTQIDRIADYFETNHAEWQGFYDQDSADGGLFRTRLRFALELCRIHAPQPTRALDLGCGCGPAAIELARMGHDVLGVDLSKSMIADARQAAARAGVADRCRFLDRDVWSLELPKRSFSLIIALGFVEYFDDPLAVLQRMASLLAHSGVIVVQTPNRLHLNSLLQARLARRVERNWAGLRIRRFTAREFSRLGRAAGLERIDYRGHAFGPIKIAGRFVPGYRAAHWLERRLDAVAQHRLTRAIGHFGACYISVLRNCPT